MIFDILTIFPDLLLSPLDEAILRKARSENKISVDITNIRDFAPDKHAMTDDRPFGGGEGMVMKPEPLTGALKHVQNHRGKGRVILLSPQGRTYTQSVAEEFAKEPHLILVCGRYEGVDERFCEKYVDEEISIGDFILTGGELAAMVLIDSVTRLLPEVLGCADSAEKDTFSRNLLKHPQYTRPREFEGTPVPVELLSGNHREIDTFRFQLSVERTLNRRPELLHEAVFTTEEIKILKKCDLYKKVKKIQDYEA